MPKVTDDFVRGRREEILEVCLKLYQTGNFKDITIKEIGELTTFTRTSIYNYFSTKEEIFLALFQREYEYWTADLNVIAADESVTTTEKFADAVANSLEKRKTLLKLLSTNLYDMEENSRFDNLVEFKKAYGNSIIALQGCLRKRLPQIDEACSKTFLYSFFPFMYGIYPYVFSTEKQLKAMDIAGVSLHSCSVYDLVYSTICKLLKQVIL